MRRVRRSRHMGQQLEHTENGIKCHFPVEGEKTRNQNGFVKNSFAQGENRAEQADFRGLWDSSEVDSSIESLWQARVDFQARVNG
jgi:hypothetical protein